jgi:HEAT repeat protein
MWGSMLDKISQLLEAQKQRNRNLVREFLEDRWSTVREVAVAVLAEIGGKEDVPYLLKMTGDSHFTVRLAAIYGLENLADKSVIPNLQKMLATYQRPEIKKALRVVIDRLAKK